MSPTFKLSCVSLDDVSKKIKKLSTRKAVQINDIPVKILKQITDIFLITFVTSSFCLNEDKFPIIFKQANTKPDFKKGYKESEKSYRLMIIFACHW